MASYIANDMRVGWVISHNGKRYSVTSITKVKPGKGGAFVQADLRDIDSGNKGGDRWRAEDKVEKLMVEDLDCQYLYVTFHDLRHIHANILLAKHVDLASVSARMGHADPEVT
ncbi:MAG: tyrosine-type recombinase/integrase, partial [Alphaproteobacteria bacterium]|nr:tyrosine-type recombinase/integrase [Alphaproteobacteria bacterium]